eukprot:scaffold3898_cov102-Skeletonema_dohrnii-CCMP3373.AAC.4
MVSIAIGAYASRSTHPYPELMLTNVSRHHVIANPSFLVINLDSMALIFPLLKTIDYDHHPALLVVGIAISISGDIHASC